jgi:hypothetical protein
MATAFNDKMIMPEKKSDDDEPSAGAMSLLGWSAIAGAVATVLFM